MVGLALRATQLLRGRTERTRLLDVARCDPHSGGKWIGKTTFARQFLPVQYPDAEFLNSDEIQRDDVAFAHRVTAGREFLRRLSDLEQRRRSLAIEITLSSRMYVKRLRTWGRLGYRMSLHFIELPSADDAVQRVVMRVAAGGHNVPEADVRRRLKGAWYFSSKCINHL